MLTMIRYVLRGKNTATCRGIVSKQYDSRSANKFEIERASTRFQLFRTTTVKDIPRLVAQLKLPSVNNKSIRETIYIRSKSYPLPNTVLRSTFEVYLVTRMKTRVFPLLHKL